MGANDVITFTADPRTNGILKGAIVTDQATGLVNLATTSGAPFSLSALTSYTNTNPTTGGAATDNDIYTASTTLTGAITANAILVRGDAITINGAFTMTPGTGMFVFVDNGNTGNTLSTAIPNFGAVEGVFITANTGGAAGAATIQSVIPATSNSGVTISGSGTLALTGANLFVNTTQATTYPYQVTMESGTLILGNATALGPVANIVDVLGGTLQTNAILTIANPLSLQTGGGALTVSGSNNLTLSGVISGPGSLVVNMAATANLLTLAGATANTYTGSTVVDLGTLTLAKTAAVAAVVGPLVIGDGAGGSNADLVTVATSNSQITGPVTINTSGQLNMGTLTATLGGLILDGGNVAGTGTITLGANIQTLAGSSAATIANPIALNGNRTFNVASGGGASDLVMTGVISGGNDLTKAGSGTLTFGGAAANTYTGQTTVVEGSLLLAKTAAVNAMTGVLVIGDFSGADTVNVTSSFNQFPTAEPVFVNGSGTLDISGSGATQTFTTLELRGVTVNTSGNTLQTNNTITGIATSTIGSTIATGSINGKLALAANTTINTADSGAAMGLAIPALISGAFALTKGGAGTLLLNGNVSNTFTGTTTVNTGTLLLNDSGGVAVPGNLVVGDLLGGQGSNKADVVRLLASNQIVQTSALTINNAGLLDFNGNSNTIGVGQTTALSITGGSVATGAGTLTLGGNVAGVANAANITPASISGNLNLGGVTRTFDVQPGALITQNPNITVANANDMAVSAIISNGGLIKNNSGTLQLAGNNTYSGATAVNAGTLLVDGSQNGSAVTVNSSATLGGVGAAGSVTDLSGTVNPGDPVSSTDTLNATSANFSSNGNLTMEITGASGSISSDLLNLSGALTLGGTSTLTLDLADLTTSTGGPITIITDASQTGLFTTVNVINNPNNFQATVNYTATTVTVNLVAPTTHFNVTAASPQTAGSAFTVTVTAVDPSGNVDPGYTGTIHFTTSDTGAGFVLPSDYTFVAGDAGSHTFTNGVTLVTTPSQTVTATDTTTPSFTGTVTEAVNPAAAASFTVITQPSATAIAGDVFAVQPVIEVLDQFGNVVTNDSTHTVTAARGNVGSATLQGSNTVTLVNGVATFSGLYYNKAETMNLVFSTNVGSFTTTSNNIVVSAATATSLIVAGFPTPTTAGTSQSFTITAQDTFGNTATGYTGSINLSSNDPLATFSPTSYHFTAADQGVHAFSGALRTVGLNQSITATDLATATITGTETGIQVNEATGNNLTLSGFPTSTVAGVQHSFTVTVRDQFGNIDTGYAGTVVFTSSDPQASFATMSYTFNPAIDAGSHTFNATLKTAGTQSLVVLDLANGLSATQAGGVTVTPAAVSQLVFTTGAPTLTAGVNSDTITVQEQDQFGNATTTTETVNLSTSNSATGLFKDEATGLTTITSVTISAGSSTASFKYVDTLASSPTLTAAATGLTTATQTETVIAAAASQLLFTTGTQTLTAGVNSGTITVQELDQFGNVSTTAETINLSTSNSGTGLFKDNATGLNTITSVTIPAGSSTASFKYVDTLVSSPTLTAAATGLTSATQTETVVAGVPVTINQKVGQADPTNVASVAFDVHFSAPVTGFDSTDVSFAGSTAGGSLVAAVTSVSGQDYVVTVTGMTSQGTVVASIPAGSAQDLSGNDNAASTSTDNSVLFDNVPPTVTINQSGVIDPTNTTVTFNVHFSEPVTGFDATDVSFAGTTGGLTPTAGVTGSGQDYVVTASGMHGVGTIVASIPAGAAQDAAGNNSTASTSTDNTRWLRRCAARR